MYTVYIVERAVCPCGSLIRVGRVYAWRKVRVTNVSVVFCCCCCSLLCSLLDKGKGLLLAVKPHQYLGSVRRWLFGDILENPEGKSILRVLLEWL